MADHDHDHDDEPTKRESHFNEQRASLRSDTSQSSSNARPRSRHQSLRSQRQNLPRTAEDFGLKPDRADSETLPSPPGSPSPAPVVPRKRSETVASREKEKRSSIGRDSATSRSKSRPRTATKGRNIEDLLVAASWDNLEFLSSPPPNVPGRSVERELYWREKLENDESSASNLPQTSRQAEPRTPTKQRSRRPSLFSRSNLSNSPQSQHNITALPTMTDDVKQQISEADRYHQSFPTLRAQRMSRLLTELYTVSFLVFFAIWGTLARLGLQALTFYPGAPVIFSELWANVAGSFIMGFFVEDIQLFREEWGSSVDELRIEQPLEQPAEAPQEPEKQRPVDRKTHTKVKKTIPLYIGLTTGFCGSFTSFSSFMRDAFLGMSNDLRSPTSSSPSPRNAGYSVQSLLAILLTTTALCTSALTLGAHLSTLLSPFTPTLPFRLTRRALSPAFALLALASWLAALLLAALPPHPTWRGQALFACVLAPLGCLLRHYLSLALNPLLPSFPLGTFAANAFGTAVLGMSYDLQRVGIGGVAGGGVVACQVLQGVQDGFCGALTTVSTWVVELKGLRRGAAYVYWGASVGVGVAVLVVVMGSVRWGVGWEAVVCVT